MDTALILQWLKLDGHAWPPDHHLLLGLPENQVDAVLAEQNALERMEWLRPHQLRHPDLVTEGMNRLAQALIALTSPPPINAVEAAPIPTLRRSSRKFRAVPEVKSKSLPNSYPEVELVPSSISDESPVPTEIVPPIFDAEVVNQKVEDKSIIPQKMVRQQSRLSTPLPLPEVYLVPEVPAEIPAGLGYRPELRRQIYAEIVLLRKFLQIWPDLAPTLGDPSALLNDPVHVYRWLKAQKKLAAITPVDLPEVNWIRSFVLYPQSMAVFRQLLPGQRQQVALLWAQCQVKIEQRHLELRRSLQTSLPKRTWRRWRYKLREAMILTPEWLALVLAALLVVLAWFSYQKLTV